VLQGTVLVNGTETIKGKELAFRARKATSSPLKQRATLLFCSKRRTIDEPLWASPFVMNTQDEIDQAMADYNAGLFNIFIAESNPNHKPK